MVVLAVVVTVFTALTVARSQALGIPLRDPGGEFVVHRVAITLAVALVLVVLDAVRRVGRRDLSWSRVRVALREKWTPRRTGLAAGALAAYHLTYFDYHNLKSWNALRGLKDAELTRWDEWLFGGNSPAVLLHDLLGTDAAAAFLIFVYESFPTLVAFSFVAAVVLPREIRDGLVFLSSLVWVWILGTVCYYVLPTLGPWDFSPEDFASLPRTVVTDTQAKYLAQRVSFLADPQAPGSFAQIGAFASLHVGVSSVIWLMLIVLRQRLLGWLMGVFVAITMVATIYVGWHYVLDDVAGLAIAAISVGLGVAMFRGPRTQSGHRQEETRTIPA